MAHLNDQEKSSVLEASSFNTENPLDLEGRGFGNTLTPTRVTENAKYDPRAQSLGWFITLWDDKIDGSLALEEKKAFDGSRQTLILSKLSELHNLDYGVGQMEKCPSTGKLHYHFILRFKTSERCFVKFQRLFGKWHHYEKQRAKQVEQAVGYCSKKESRVDGPWIIGSGMTQTRLTEIMDAYVPKELKAQASAVKVMPARLKRELEEHQYEEACRASLKNVMSNFNMYDRTYGSIRIDPLSHSQSSLEIDD